ncbi:MAG: DUF1499 domain-containing protein [Spirulina sp. SIO3F2]|nr:DUF1499 domain-containing protein [Spirulina sp. SIO3F2]
MKRVLTFCLISLITLASGWSFNSASAMAALPGMSALFAGNAPELGVMDGHLRACPDSPNCVVSQGGDTAHQIEPIAYQGDRATVREAMLKVLAVVPRTQVVTETEDYIRAASESRLLGFVDDLEFYFPADAGVIEVRSASRLGESDLGVNRRRLEQIRLALVDLGVAQM